MDPGRRAHLRKAARVRDESQQDKRFRLALSQADADKAEANRKADRVKEQKAAEKRDKLQAFKPVLDLMKLEEMTVNGDLASRIRQQLIWHRDIGNDTNLKGIHKMNKEEAWANMICAVQRHHDGVSSMTGTEILYSSTVD